MLSIHRPGQVPLEVEFILIDFDGTLASDRRVHPKTKDRINLLAKRTKIYILAKGEREVIRDILRKVKAEIVFSSEGQCSQERLELLTRLGKDRTVAIGNGQEDASMIEEAALAICVIGKEGASGGALRKADVIVTDILDALDFLLKPLRHQATLSL